MVGIPITRLTYIPSVNSLAALLAILFLTSLPFGALYLSKNNKIKNYCYLGIIYRFQDHRPIFR